MLKTEKDYSDPFVRQLSLFLENHVGKLREILRYLTTEDILVHAISVIDSADHAIVRLVGALMLETNDEWTVARRYMSLETLARVTDNPTVRLPAVAT